jgi:predicted esterase
MRRAFWSLALASLGSAALGPEALAEPKPKAWCASELETIRDGVCYYEAEAPGAAASAAPVHAEPDTLVLYLHTLVGTGSTWQWEQQRIMWTAAKTYGFSVVMPKGRPGIGPKRAPDVLAWPTSPKAQEAVEDELVAEWQELRETLERRRGRPFRRVWVFGFSNGAYYGTSLALRARLPVEGYAVFAGGAGGKYSWILGSKAPRKTPIFVGYGTRDPAREDMKDLITVLKKLGWPHQSLAQPVGHIVTHDQLRRAVQFLTSHAEQP